MLNSNNNNGIYESFLSYKSKGFYFSKSILIYKKTQSKNVNIKIEKTSFIKNLKLIGQKRIGQNKNKNASQKRRKAENQIRQLTDQQLAEKINLRRNDRSESANTRDENEQSISHAGREHMRRVYIGRVEGR